MNTTTDSIILNAVAYFGGEIRRWVALANEAGIPASVRAARILRARAEAAKCRSFRRGEVMA